MKKNKGHKNESSDEQRQKSNGFLGKNIGFIKLPRNIFDHPLFEDAWTYKLFSYCATKANYKAVDLPFNCQTVHLERGQFIFGLHEASKCLKMSIKKIRKRLSLLRNSKLLTRKTTNRFSIITILNYDCFQGPEKANQQEEGKQRGRNGHPKGQAEKLLKAHVGAYENTPGVGKGQAEKHEKGQKRATVKEVKEVLRKSQSIRTDDSSLLIEKTKEISRGQTKTKNNRSSATSQLGVEKKFAAPPENDRESYPNANGFDFGAFVAPYRDRKDLDTPLAPHEEDQINTFYESMLSAHWNKKYRRPGPGMKRLFFRACRDGAGEKFGLVFRSLEQIEEDRKEKEKLTAETDRGREEEDRRRREEEKKGERKREKFKKLILEKPVHDLLKFMHISLDFQPENSFRDQAKKYLNDIMKGSGAENRTDLVKACEKELVHQMRIRESDERMTLRH